MRETEREVVVVVREAEQWARAGLDQSELDSNQPLPDHSLLPPSPWRRLPSPPLTTAPIDPSSPPQLPFKLAYYRGGGGAAPS
jgi:hypothetical protein